MKNKGLISSTFSAVFILMLFLQLADAQSISVSAEINYKMISDESIHDVFILRFKNLNETQAKLLDFFIALPVNKQARLTGVKDVPDGYFSMEYTTDERGLNYSIISVRKTLAPSEEYVLTIEREIENPLEKVDENVYTFFTFEFPSYFRDFGYDVSLFKISLEFPDSILTNYNILSASSNPKFQYKTFNRIESVKWEFIDPPNQISVFVSFEKVPNYFIINLIGAGLTLVSFTAILYYTFGLERKLRKHEVVKNPPWSGDLLAKMKDMIRRAEREVLITSPHIYYTDWLTAELQPLINRGVRFRIITWPSYKREMYKSVEEVQEDRKQYFTLKRFLEMFPAGSVKLNDNIHAKMLVVDEREVLITTANLSQTGFYENYEIGVYAENPALARKAKEFFELVWNSEDSITLDEQTIDSKVSWALIMDIKSKKEGEK